jgi:hypothetical protein
MIAKSVPLASRISTGVASVVVTAAASPLALRTAPTRVPCGARRLHAADRLGSVPHQESTRFRVGMPRRCLTPFMDSKQIDGDSDVSDAMTQIGTIVSCVWVQAE